jgi:hypothetical protein
MAPKGRKESRPLEMPDEPVRRSERIEQRKRQAEAKQPRQSLRIAKIPQKEVQLQHGKRKSITKQQEQDTQDGRASVKKVRGSKISKSQSHKKDTFKQAEARTGSRSKQTKGPPITLQVEEQRLGAERQQAEPATEGQLQEVATAPRPKRSNKRTKQPPASSRLSRAALDQLQRETANEPLPEEIRQVILLVPFALFGPYSSGLALLVRYSSSLTPGQYKPFLSEDSMAKSLNENVAKERATTVYSQTFVDELEDRGILDHQFEYDGFKLERPSNYDEIRNAIEGDRPKDQPTEADYKMYTELALSVSNETTQRKVYTEFFGDPPMPKRPHRTSDDEMWTRHKPITGELDLKKCKKVPKPDLAEGLLVNQVPLWIRETLSGYSVPRAHLSFPNYIVELKRDKSMFTGHVQNRHCGAIASQAFVEYFAELDDESKLAWDTAKVGSIVFNGYTVTGSIHWASSSDKSGEDRKVRQYHTTRVMCHFTYGLGYEDFKIARKEARNFREYFLKDRENFLERCRNLKEREPRNKRPIQIDDENERDSEANENEMWEENDEGDDNDGAIHGQQETLKPANPKAARSSQKRKEAVKLGSETNKRRRSKRKSRNFQNAEPTGLSQETQGMRLG